MAATNSLTVARLRELLHYDPDTGTFTRRVAIGYRGCHKAGEDTGCTKGSGYVVIRIDGTLYGAHRLAWLYVHGEWPPNDIDHINMVRHDNRLCNLRLATRSENMQNRRCAQSNNRTGLLGVSWYAQHKKYHAQIHVNRKHYSLGWFDTPEEAHTAYLAAKRKLHPGGML